MARHGRKTLLIIDDEATFCIAVRDYLARDGLEAVFAHTGAEGLAVCSRQWVDVVILDQRLPDGDGHRLVPEILGKNDKCKIIFVTAFPTVENAVTAVRSGAHDYLSKPVDMEELRISTENALRVLDLEQVETIHEFEVERERVETDVIGLSGGLAPLAALIESASRNKANVLITGETGTGKNLVAKAIHYGDPARRSTFLSVNCAALPASLVEAELFGYERGSFTGATDAKPGMFEMADGGTLFLDEIGDMPLQLQAKLLSVLEERSVRRIGGALAKPVDVRIIAATNAELEQSLDRTFRTDLYYRLCVIELDIPPLRQRRQDIPELCAHILKRKSGGKSLELPRDELAKLAAYDWPGNVRELMNVLERAILFGAGGVLRPSRFLDTCLRGQEEKQPLPRYKPVDSGAVKTLDEAEREYISSALAHFSGNISRTAKALGISLSTLKRKIRGEGADYRENKNIVD